MQSLTLLLSLRCFLGVSYLRTTLVSLLWLQWLLWIFSKKASNLMLKSWKKRCGYVKKNLIKIFKFLLGCVNLNFLVNSLQIVQKQREEKLIELLKNRLHLYVQNKEEFVRHAEAEVSKLSNAGNIHLFFFQLIFLNNLSFYYMARFLQLTVWICWTQLGIFMHDKRPRSLVKRQFF